MRESRLLMLVGRRGGAGAYLRLHEPGNGTPSPGVVVRPGRGCRSRELRLCDAPGGDPTRARLDTEATRLGGGLLPKLGVERAARPAGANRRPGPGNIPQARRSCPPAQVQ